MKQRLNLNQIALRIDEHPHDKLFEPRMCTAEGLLDPEWVTSVGVGMLVCACGWVYRVVGRCTVSLVVKGFMSPTVGARVLYT